MKTRILLVDDHQLVRQGLRAMLSAEPDMEIVGQADNGRVAAEMAEQLNPDLVVMDVAMPVLNGIDSARRIRSANPTIKIVVLSAFVDDNTAAELLNVGAGGLVPKDAAFEELAKAIRSVMAGETYLSPAIAGGVIERLLRKPDDNGHSVFRQLSPREREVLQLMAEGRSTKEVAYDLDVSVKTVETHRRQLMDKLGLYTVAELTRYAVRERLVTL